MEITSLDRTAPDVLYAAFAEAFADYGIALAPHLFRNMMQRRGFDPSLSFAAFDAGRIAAFTLNGIGLHEERATAYDTGTGTLPAYRGRGLAAEIFEYAIPHLKRAGIRQYLLEVLQDNTKALNVYRKLGFETTREFNFFIREKSLTNLRDTPPSAATEEFESRRIPIDEIGLFAPFEDFRPAWQNSDDAIRRAPEAFVCTALYCGRQPVGYCVVEPATGDIPRIGVDRRYRRRGLGTRLLREAAALIESDKVRIINTDTRDEAMTGLLAASGIPITGKQFEMIREF